MKPTTTHPEPLIPPFPPEPAAPSPTPQEEPAVSVPEEETPPVAPEVPICTPAQDANGTCPK